MGSHGTQDAKGKQEKMCRIERTCFDLLHQECDKLMYTSWRGILSLFIDKLLHGELFQIRLFKNSLI